MRWSALLAVAVVVVNLLLSSISLAWAARVSPTALMGAALGGFLVRMMLVTAVVIAVKGSAWVDLTALAVAILVTHLPCSSGRPGTWAPTSPIPVSSLRKGA